MRAITHHKNFKGRFAARNVAQQQGFTLIELLVVMALMTILLTLIFKPLLDTFNLTSRAGTQIEAQETARDVMRQISTTLSDAVYVYDNAQTPIYIWVPKNVAGQQTPILTNYAMIEYVRPAHQLDQNNTYPIDPTTGDPIYPATASAGQGGFSLPLTQGRTLGRIFIGLATNKAKGASGNGPDGNPLNGQPAVPYANKYERDSTADNRYTLYKAEVQTSIQEPNGTNYIPNLKLFHTLDSKGTIVDTATSGGEPTAVQLYDPNFFYDNSPAGGKETGAGGQMWAVPGAVPTGGTDGKTYTIADNWRAVSSALLLPKKVDAISLDRDPNGTNIVFDQNTGLPTLHPLVLFSPNYVENDPGTPSRVENAGNEAQAAPAAAFLTQYSHWDDPYRVQVFRVEYKKPPFDLAADPMTQNPLSYYQYAPPDDTNSKPRILHTTVSPSGFSAAPTPVGPNVDPVSGVWLDPPNVPYTNANFFAYTVDSRSGMINFGFPWSVLCYDAKNNPVPQKYDPADVNASFLDPDGSGTAETVKKRYIWLGKPLSTKMYAGSPLNPTTAKSPFDTAVLGRFPADAMGNPQMPRISIIAGSERIFGPDQRPGPHYGYRVQYSRVSSSAGIIGPNEYKINYTDVQNATIASSSYLVRGGYIEFDSVPDISDAQPSMADFGSGVTNFENAVPPASSSVGIPLGYRPHSLPQIRAVPDSSGVLMNVPAAPIEVSYSFQMNRTNDVVKADYLTRELMNISMNIRYYDPRSGRPQEMSLTSQVKVRNLQR